MLAVGLASRSMHFPVLSLQPRGLSKDGPGHQGCLLRRPGCGLRDDAVGARGGDHKNAAGAYGLHLVSLSGVLSDDFRYHSTSMILYLVVDFGNVICSSQHTTLRDSPNVLFQ